MKRIALFAAASIVLAACSAKTDAPMADSAAAPAAAAPAMMDSSAMTPPPAMADSAAMAAPGAMAAPMDSTKKH